jgi:hypothetical protein
MERPLPYNYDGSSCFLHSLLCALFFPNKLRVMDPYVLLGKRADMENEDRKNLSHVLRVVARCIRGVRTGEQETYAAVRPVIASLLYNLVQYRCDVGQQDPIDLFEVLLRVYNVGGVFNTKKTVQTVYKSGKKTATVSTDEMFRYSVLHSGAGKSVIRFETLFPGVETFHNEGTNTDPQEDPLVSQRTITEFGGGPILVLTRETFIQPVHYGRWSYSTNAYLLPVLNTLEKCVQWYELQAVLCWKGVQSAAGEAGHYVCFVYDDAAETWYFYNDMNHVTKGLAGLDTVPQLEAHATYPPSETGVLFLYARVPSPPKDI